MFERLQKKWKVKGWQLLLILCTFAIGGSLTGFVGKKIMNLLNIGQDWLWAIVYILLITLVWPMMVVLISIPFGQFKFFRNYISKLGEKMGFVRRAAPDSVHPNTVVEAPIAQSRKNIAIFASGAGSNAQKIINFFKSTPENSHVSIALIVCNRPGAGVMRIAEVENIPSILVDKNSFFHSDDTLAKLREHGIDFIVLAGFLWKIPPNLIAAYPGQIVNIHPALLPKYGGRGMYGHHVHEAVIANKDTESGISIHYVDEIYDHGKIIFQARCPVLPDDTADSLAGRVHELEHQHYPRIIAELI